MTISGLKLNYVVSGYGGFGGPIRMMLDDAGVDYEYNYIEFFEDFLKKVKFQWIESGHPFDCAPMIELDGKRYSACTSIMRFLSKKMGKYTPTDIDLEQFVDATSDYAIDWLRKIFSAMYTNAVEEFKENDLETFLKRFDGIYGVHKGPYAAGEEISYCDFYVYVTMISGPNKGAFDNYPNLSALGKAIRARPNLQEALKQLDQKRF